MRKNESGLCLRLMACLVLGVALGASSSIAEAKGRPIIDTHIHLYQVTRSGGVPWPPPENKVLYRDVTPKNYKALAKKHGVIGTGIMEASPINEDNQKLLKWVGKDRFFKFLVAQLEIGSDDFIENLDALAKDPRVVGIRGFLWSPKMILDDQQVSHLEELAKRGMTLDLISRGDLNPKDKIVALAKRVPHLRIIIDHLGGAKGNKPDPAWEKDMQKLAAQKNIYMKFSSFFDMFNPAATEDKAWKSPTDLAAYKPHFDVLMATFGEDRLIWGSNWPVVELGGTFADQIDLAEQYLKPKGIKTRDKVMFENARKFYRRVPPKN